jgi:hypothetical protein
MKRAFGAALALIVAAGVAAALLTLTFGDLRFYPLVLPFTFAFGLVIGLPMYIISRSVGRAGWVAAVGFGFLAGAVLPALAVLGGAPDQASIGGVPTVVDGAYTAYGWIQNLLFVGSFGAIGAVAGLAFWAIVRNRNAGGDEQADAQGGGKSVSGGKIAALSAGAVAVIAAAFIIPPATMDRSCHNTMRDGRRSIGPEATFDLTADAREWQSIASEVEAFGRSRGWAIISDVRPDGGFQWFQMSLCMEPGTNISVQGMADLGRVSFAVYQPQGGPSWREPFVELYSRIRRRWPGRIQFQGAQGQPIGPPAWVPRDVQTPSQASPSGNSSAE